MAEEVEGEREECVCSKVCPSCGCIKTELSVYDRTFWDMWAQKLLRNVASMKFQWLLLLYIPTIIGMFNLMPNTTPPTPWISATLGLGFLGGGFVTLALGRIVAQTRLKENGKNGVLDTEK